MRKKGIIYALIAAICWGAGYVSQSYGLAHVHPLAMISGRYIIATLLLLPSALKNVPFSGEGKRIWNRDFKHYPQTPKVISPGDFLKVIMDSNE